jgi:hypothetical protein
MAQVTVDFEDYQSGSLPDVCVLTGVATQDRMVFRTAIRGPVTGSKPPGRFLGSFDSLFDTLDPRRAQHTLLGRLPIEREALQARLIQQRIWKLGRWAAIVLLVVAAWVSASWSPIVAVAAAAGIVVASIRGRELQKGLPSPTLIGAGSKVHLQNVHESFVAAVERARRAVDRD